VQSSLLPSLPPSLPPSSLPSPPPPPPFKPHAHPILGFDVDFARASVKDEGAVLPFFLPLGQALCVEAGPVLGGGHRIIFVWLYNM
jgi:hypothetical protein